VRSSLTRFSMWYSQLGLFDPAYVRETIQQPDHKPILGGGITFTGAYGKQFHLEPGICSPKPPGVGRYRAIPSSSPRRLRAALVGVLVSDLARAGWWPCEWSMLSSSRDDDGKWCRTPLVWTATKSAAFREKFSARAVPAGRPARQPVLVCRQ